MLKIPNRTLMLALLAALAALLVAWLVPLPRLVLSEEEKAGDRMPQNRAAVESARADFERAQSDYKAYVASHDVGAALTALEAATPDNGSNLAQPVLDYLQQLATYASAGERYFSALSHYDDELMAWSRSLGTASESLRPDTWPIVEYLKRYPPPVGEATDYLNIHAADVQSYSAALTRFASLQASPNPNATPEALLSVSIAAVRQAGRSIEYQESLHDAYHQYLTDYDEKVQALTSNSDTNTLTSGRVTFATGINVLLGLVILVGLAALFLPRSSKANEITE